VPLLTINQLLQAFDKIYQMVTSLIVIFRWHTDLIQMMMMTTEYLGSGDKLPALWVVEQVLWVVEQVL
jgi:hypothetical protein